MRILTLAFGAVVLSAVACSDEEDPSERLEAACEAYCDAAFGNCSVQGLDADTCRASCGHLEQQLGEQCLEEYADVFECGADGGFTCTENGPLPNDGCLDQNLALVECTSEAGCNDYCSEVASAGCLPEGSVTECVLACQQRRDSLGTCSTLYNNYLQCVSLFGGVVCADGEPTSPECDEDLTDIADHWYIAEDKILRQTRELVVKVRDPLVGRLDHLLQIRIRQQVGRHVRAKARNLHAPERLHHN